MSDKDFREGERVRDDLKEFVETLEGVSDKQVLIGLSLLREEFSLRVLWSRLDG